jgi:hypothetical protein
MALLEDWNGTHEHARALRSALRAVAFPKGALAGRDALLRKVRAAFDEGKPARLLLAPKERTPDAVTWLAPFLGDPSAGPWPFEAMAGLTDDGAREWLEALADATPEPSVLAFAREMFQVRRRSVWPRASWLLAGLARQDAALRDEATKLIGRTFKKGAAPGAIEDQFPKAPESDFVADGGRGGRHLFHLACALVARGVELEGWSASAVAAMQLPAESFDAAAMLLGLAALTRLDPSARAIVAAVPRLLEQCAGPRAECHQVHDALRHLHDLLSDAEANSARQEIRQWLATPRWEAAKADAARRFDVLWGWLDSMDWLARTQGLDVKTVAAGEAALALRLRVDPTPVDDADVLAIERIALLDDAVLASIPERRLICRMAELMLLFSRPELRDATLQALFTRALGREHAHDAPNLPVRLVGRAWVTRQLAEHGRSWAALLHEVEIDHEGVLALTASHEQKLVLQVAIQLERLLRHATPIERVRLLFQVLRRDPPHALFTELAALLRRSETKLVELVRRLATLDRKRDERASSGHDLAEAFAAVAEGAEVLIAGQRGDLPIDLTELAGALAGARKVLPTLWPGNDDWTTPLENLLGEGGIVIRWRQWLEMDTKTLAEVWEKLPLAGTNAYFKPSAETLRALNQSIDALGHAITGSAWPEVDLLGELVTALRKIATALAKDVATAREWNRLMDAGDADELVGKVEKVTEADLRKLPPGLLQRVGKFLLSHLRFDDAFKYRRRIAGAVPVPSLLTWFAPLLVGSCAGALLVLDVGTVWNVMAVAGRELQLAGMIAVTLALSFALLFADLAQRVVRRAAEGQSRGAYGLTIAGRILPVLGVSLVVAFTASSLVLLTLAGTDARSIDGMPIPFVPQALLWAALSQFLGIFLGLMLAGRSVTDEKASD